MPNKGQPKTKGKPQGKPKTPSRSQKRSGAAHASRVLAPVATGRAYSGTFQPHMTTSMRGGKVVVRVRSALEGELVGDLLANSTGALTVPVNQGVNPGNAVLFPWLSTVAPSYECYRFLRLHFRYETECATTQPGTALLAFDPNISDTTLTTKQDLMQLAAHARSPPWQRNDFAIPGSLMHVTGPERFVRTGAVPTGTDAKLYDTGLFYAAFSGTTSASNLGELYVDYEVEFIGMQPSVSTRTLASSRRIVGATSITVAAPFGTAPTFTGDLALTAASATMTFNSVGTYMVTSVITGTVITDTGPTLTGTATAYVINTTMFHTTAATSGLLQALVTVTAPGQTVIWDFTASATTISASTTRVARYTYSLT